MLNLSVATNAKQIAREFGDLSDDKVRRGVSAAIKRTLPAMRKRAIEAVREEYTVKAKELKARAFTIRNPSPRRLIGELILTGTRLRVYAFGAKQRSAGVQVEIRKGVKKIIAHSFIARMPNDHRGVFSRARYVPGKAGQKMRARKSKEAIFERYTISYPEMLGKKQILEIVSKLAIDKFEERLLHELRFRSGK